MIKAVGFDLWETLITSPPELARRHEERRLARLEAALHSLGLSGVTRPTLEQAYRDGWTRCHELYWSADIDIPCSRQVLHLMELLGLEEDSLSDRVLETVEAAYVGTPTEDPPPLVDGALEMLAQLKEMGLRLGLISNTGRAPGRALREVLHHHQIAHYLDAMVFSDEHGECKPRPSIFESLSRALEVKAEEIVFVGDHPWIDVTGAKRGGMKAVHFIPVARGNAVAPDVEFETETPDAVITDLRDLPSILEGMLA